LYYHIKIELKEKDKKDNYTKLSELDKTEINEIINDTILPYLQGEEFLFDGRMLIKNDIRSIKIFETSELSQTLVNIEDNKHRNAGFYFGRKKQNVVALDIYSKDITKNIFARVKDKIKNINKKEVPEKIKIIDKNKTDIFIVHGHDDLAKNEMARFVEQMNFKPIILHEQASEGTTIIEKIEKYSNVGFGIVLYTACDVGAKISDKDNLNDRARQNVVFEHGFLNGKLGRKNVCAFVKGNIETPNDISGIVYVPLDAHGAWKIALAKELRASGYDVDMNKMI